MTKDGHVPEKFLNDVLESMDIGYFHYRLLLMCGLSFMADAMEVSLLSFMSTCAGVEWDLSDTQIAGITSAVFAGELFGSIFWGVFADKYGRRWTFLLGSVTITLFGFLSGAAPNYEVLLCFRGLVGFGVGGLFVPFDILAEFMPTAHRGQYLMAINYFWTIGSMFVAALAWICLSSEGWRTLTYLTVIPVAISSALAAIYLPESPRWLIIEGRSEEAAQIVREMAAMNGQTLDPFKFHQSVQHDHAMTLSDFFSREHISLTIPLWSVWLTFGFCYYAVILFVTVVFEKTDENDDGLTCDFDYAPIFLTAVSEVAGIFFVAVGIDRMGRVKSQIIYFAAAGLFVALMGAHLTGSGLLAVSLFARMAAVAATCAVWVSTPELYPTEIRASAHAAANCMARVGALLSPFIAESRNLSHLGIGLIIGIVNLCGAMAAYFLPETAGKSLTDTKEEAADLAEYKHKLTELVLGGQKVVVSPLSQLSDCGSVE